MKVYEVECRSVITESEQDIEKAALHAAALFKDNPDFIYVRAVHERNFEPTGEDPSLNQKGIGHETAIRGIQYCPRFGVSDSRYGLC